MASVWLHSALWLGLARLASLISIRIAISVALIEIVVGAAVGNLFSLQITGGSGSGRGTVRSPERIPQGEFRRMSSC
jgi:Kef-type K+ transport system membrane component KefB